MTFSDEKAAARRALERREHYKAVRAHVEKDGGRTQAYGWSLPSSPVREASDQSASKGSTPVPVPVYCRPLMEKDTDMRVGENGYSV